MKAIKVHEFGGPEVMKPEEIERPVPAADEILVKMYATSVSPADYIVREGGNEVLRSFLKLPMGLGLDAAGVVEETGSQVTVFKKGGKVYGIKIISYCFYQFNFEKTQGQQSDCFLSFSN